VHSPIATLFLVWQDPSSTTLLRLAGLFRRRALARPRRLRGATPSRLPDSVRSHIPVTIHLGRASHDRYDAQRLAAHNLASSWPSTPLANDNKRPIGRPRATRGVRHEMPNKPSCRHRRRAAPRRPFLFHKCVQSRIGRYTVTSVPLPQERIKDRSCVKPDHSSDYSPSRPSW
jgi:hypothetical protein